MKYAILVIVMVCLILFIVFPWYDCKVETIANTKFSGLSILVNARTITSQKIPLQLVDGGIVGYQHISCLPGGTGILLTAVYLVLIILIGVGALLTCKQSPGLLWFWIVAFVTSVVSWILLFTSSSDIPTSRFLIGANLSFVNGLLLIGLLLVGMIMSLIRAFRQRSQKQ